MLTIRQLRKRKVAQWVLGYTAVAWALLQGVGLLAGTYGWSATPMRVGVALAVLGFFLTLVIAWFQGERGQQKVTRLEVIMIAIVVIVADGALDIRILAHRRDTAGQRHPHDREGPLDRRVAAGEHEHRQGAAVL